MNKKFVRFNPNDKESLKDLPDTVRDLVDLTDALDKGITALMRSQFLSTNANEMMLGTAAVTVFGVIAGRIAAFPPPSMTPEEFKDEVALMFSKNFERNLKIITET